MKKLLAALALAASAVLISGSSVFADNLPNGGNATISVSQPAYIGGTGTVTQSSNVQHPGASASCYQQGVFVWSQFIDLTVIDYFTFSGMNLDSANGVASCTVTLMKISSAGKNTPVAQSTFSVQP